MILVTGASGFIGSHLVEALKTVRLRALIRDGMEFLEDIPKEILGEIEIKQGDLLDRKSLVSALNGVEKVYHLGGIGKPMNIPKHKYYDINVEGTKNLLWACNETNVRKVIHVSSMSIFGYSRDGKPLTENSPRLPVSDYGKSKKTGEEFAYEYCKINNIKLIIIRPPMVFGPRDFQVLKLFKAIKSGFFPLLKKGNAKFELCYVKNLVNGIKLADEIGVNLEAYNINDGETYTIKEVFQEIANIENTKLLPFSIPVSTLRFTGFVFEKAYSCIGKRAPFNSGTALWMSNDNWMDINKAKNDLGYKRITCIENAIRETYEWYKLNQYL